MWWFWLWVHFVTVLLILLVAYGYGRDVAPQGYVPTREERAVPEAVGNRSLGAGLVWTALGLGVAWLLLAFVWTM